MTTAKQRAARALFVKRVKSGYFKKKQKRITKHIKRRISQTKKRTQRTAKKTFVVLNQTDAIKAAQAIDKFFQTR